MDRLQSPEPEMTHLDGDLPPIPKGHRSEAETDFIAEVLRSNLPLHCELIGRNNVVEVSRGTEFEEPIGGHRLDMTAMLNNLSSIATVIQFCALAAGWAVAKARKAAPNGAGQPTSVLLSAVFQRFGNDPRVLAVLREEPEIVDKVVADVLARFAISQGPTPTT